MPLFAHPESHYFGVLWGNQDLSLQQRCLVLLGVLCGANRMHDAEIWFDGTKMQQTGAVRQFVTPSLEPGKSYTYEVRARWTQNGQPMEETRTVQVRNGRQAFVDFNSPVPK